MATHPPISLIHQVEDRLVSELGRVARLRIPDLCEQLETMGERQTRPADRQALFAAAAMLRVRLSTTSSMPELMAARKARSTRASLIQDAERRAIVLLDEDDLETQILAQDLASAIVSEAGADYPAYLHMLGEIAPSSWKDEEINPLAAKSVAAILIEALRTPSDSGLVRSTLRGLTVKAFAPDVAKVIHTLNGQMIEAGVVPAPGFTLKRSEDSAARNAENFFARMTGTEPGGKVVSLDESRPAAVVPAVAPASPAAGAERQALDVSREVYSADRLGRNPLAKSAEGQSLPPQAILQPVVEIERDAVAFAHSMGVMPYGRQARASFFARNRQRLKDGNATSGQLATLDIVAAMFDYVVDDGRLPEPVKPLFWRLQQPSLALCLLDPSYLSEDSRSLRKLIENFGAIATAFSGEITRGSELHRRLETVVRAVEIVTSSLQSRSSVMASQVEKEYQKASKSVTQLVEKIARERSALESTPQRRNRRDYSARPSKERELAVTDEISRSLNERFSHYNVPQSVKDFLTTVWVRQLRTAALRDGVESAEYKVAMQVVDDLLWSLNNDRRQQSRKELAERIPPLIRLLTDGVKRVGAKEEEQKAFFDELFLVHLRKMSKRARSKDSIRPEDVVMPEELVHQMAAAPKKARGPANTGSSLDPEATLATVPKLDEAIDTRLHHGAATEIPGTLRGMEAREKRKAGRADKSGPVSIPRFAANTSPFPSSRDRNAKVGKSSPDGRNDLEKELIAPTHLRVVPPAEAPTDMQPTTRARLKARTRPAIEPVQRVEAAPMHPSMMPVAPVSVPPVVPVKPVHESPAPHEGEKVLTEDDSAQLFEVMNAVDLSDCPPEQSSMDLTPQAALDAISKGSWIRLTSRDGEVSMFKVAWVNHQRTLALLVRFPDRRALSLRFGDMRKRLEEGHAALMSLPEA